ncbi:hypothetical protein IF2G_03760 [Cordyceps javanica]|nr:hypothetical protein IF2G_03760 [Cordyceps javanica]
MQCGWHSWSRPRASPGELPPSMSCGGAAAARLRSQPAAAHSHPVPPAESL